MSDDGGAKSGCLGDAGAEFGAFDAEFGAFDAEIVDRDAAEGEQSV